MAEEVPPRTVEGQLLYRQFQRVCLASEIFENAQERAGAKGELAEAHLAVAEAELQALVDLVKSQLSRCKKMTPSSHLHALN